MSQLNAQTKCTICTHKYVHVRTYICNIMYVRTLTHIRTYISTYEMCSHEHTYTIHTINNTLQTVSHRAYLCTYVRNHTHMYTCASNSLIEYVACTHVQMHRRDPHRCMHVRTYFVRYIRMYYCMYILHMYAHTNECTYGMDVCIILFSEAQYTYVRYALTYVCTVHT